MNSIENNILSFWKTLIHQATIVTPKVIVGLVIIILAWVAGIIVKHFVVHLANHSKKRVYLYRILGSLAMILILIMGIIMGLGTMGINVGALIASLGLVGFALGLALKDLLSNTISGFMILFYQPFKVGDFITVSSVEGRVVDVSLRYTVVKTDDKHTFVPNATVLTNPLTVKDGDGEIVNE